MNVLVIGGGGREHALVWKISQSSLADKIFCAPGNAGIQDLAKTIDISDADIPGLISFVKKNDVGLTVVGPEIPLSNGIVDSFEQEGLLIFGPSAKATMLEGSKKFAKNFMARKGIPTAKHEVFDNYSKACNYIESQCVPIVIKADGLAAGKGAVVCNSLKEAQNVLEEMMVKLLFGEAGRQVVIEEFLSGQEISVLAFTDGNNIVSLIPAQDHKPVYDNNLGPNTGGMGSYAPVPFVEKKLQQQVREQILVPVVKGLADEGIKYKGILYAGLMITEDGPKVVEFNARFGDPETQAILPLLDFDLLEILVSVAGESLPDRELKIKNMFATCVVMSSAGYPGGYEKNKKIQGLNQNFGENVMVFHAGTKLHDGQIVTNGGRVLGITAWSGELKESIDLVYGVVKQIHFDGAYFRNDIGKKGLS